MATTNEELQELTHIVHQTILEMKYHNELNNPLVITNKLADCIAKNLFNLNVSPKQLLEDKHTLKQVCRFTFVLMHDPALRNNQEATQQLTEQFLMRLAKIQDLKKDAPNNKAAREELHRLEKDTFKMLYKLEPERYPPLNEEKLDELAEKLTSINMKLRFSPPGSYKPTPAEEAEISMRGRILRTNTFALAFVDTSNKANYMGLNDEGDRSLISVLTILDHEKVKDGLEEEAQELQENIKSSSIRPPRPGADPYSPFK